MLEAVTILDTGLRCFQAPCFNVEIRDSANKKIDVVSDLFFPFTDAAVAIANPSLPLRNVSGYVIEYFNPETGQTHRAFVVQQR